MRGGLTDGESERRAGGGRGGGELASKGSGKWRKGGGGRGVFITFSTQKCSWELIMTDTPRAVGYQT